MGEDALSAQQHSVGIDWWRLARIGLPALVVSVALIAGLIQGPGVAILVLAGASMAIAVGFFWETLRALFGDTKLSGEDAFAMGAPSAELERKQALVRALKDLEFEHSVGKISERDYQSLKYKYRTEAKRLLRVLDERARPERERVEKLVHQRLVAEGLAKQERQADPLEKQSKKNKRKTKKKRKKKPPAEPPSPTQTPSEREAPRAAADEVQLCAQCDGENDGDALFCKKCGKPIGEPAETTTVSEKTGIKEATSS